MTIWVKIKRIFNIVLPLLCFLLFSSPVLAAPEWTEVDISTYDSRAGDLIPDSVSMTEYTLSVTYDGELQTPTINFSSSGTLSDYSFKDAGTVKPFNSSISLDGTVKTLTMYGFAGHGVGSWSSNVLEAGSYHGYMSFTFSPDYYTKKNKEVYVVGVTGARAWLGSTEVPCFWDQGVLMVLIKNPIYLPVYSRLTVNFYFDGVFSYNLDSTLGRDDFRVNLGTTPNNPHINYWPGNINDPENIDDYNSDLNSFDQALGAGESAEKGLTDTAYTNINSFEYEPVSSSGMASALSFYSAVVMAGYTSLADFQTLWKISLTIIVIMVLLRIRGRGS